MVSAAPGSPTVGELFAGYGGLGMGLAEVWPEAQIRWTSDTDEAASRVLARHLPDAPNLGDVEQIHWEDVEPVDIVAGGSPCQDLSVAGRGAGMKPGTRSGLWASMVAGIDYLRPQLVVWENVRGAYSAPAHSLMEPCQGCLGDGPGQPPLRALGRVLGDLASVGYDAIWTGLRASDVGAPHQRARLFVIAWPAHPDGLRPERTWSPWDWIPGPEDLGGDTREALAGPLLRTVSAAEDDGGSVHPDVNAGRRHQVRLKDQIEALSGLLPTPRATDGTKGGPHQRGSSGDLMLPSAVHLMPTPTAADSGASGGHPLGANVTLTDATVRLRDRFGQYAPAIARWERVLGRPSPPPVEPTGADGRLRLSPRFAEFLMGLPAGWITDTPGVTRRDALRLCGNGVVPSQSAKAVRALIGLRTAYALPGTRGVAP